MKINVIGIPSHAGALYPGTDEAPQAIRRARLFESFDEAGIAARDAGDLSLPPYLPRHNLAPIRNWPAPRMVWERMSSQTDLLFNPEHFSLLLGGDCSIVVGSVECLTQIYGSDIHVILIDAHVDAISPHPAHCMGAAGMGLWFLTQENFFWQKPAWFDSNHLTVLACQSVPDGTREIPHITLHQLRDQGIGETAVNLLASIPKHSKILIHFDVDAIGKQEMPAAYSPSVEGLTISEIKQLLSTLIADSRVIGMEVTEFSAFRDPELISAKRVVDLLRDVFLDKKR